MGRKELLIITIAILITILSWAVLDIIHKRAKVEVSASWQKAAEPISPDFDLKGLEQN